MKIKNGFTLIELLAVIVILAIILAIAIPSITNIIENSQVNAFRSDEKMLLKAAKLYVGTNDSALPTNIGDTKEITLSTLQTNGYVATIKDPVDRITACNGYVIITKTDTSEYDYTPYLNCENNIGTSTADGLIAHYQFDDFQEPTTNLVVSPEFTTNSLGTGWGSWAPGVLTFGSVDLLDKQTNYTNITKNVDNTTNAIHQGIAGLTVGNPYTLSFYVRINPSASASTGIIRAYINNYVDYSITKEWTKVVLTQTAAATTQVIHITQSSTAYDVQVAYVSFEQKNYATPFVNGSRTGVIKDYSGHSNNATLQLSSTPKWVNNSKTGAGAYYFDGVNSYIGTNLSRATVGTNATFTAWVYMEQNLSGYMPIMAIYSTTSISWSFFMGKNTGSSLTLGVEDSTYAPNTGVSLSVGKWQHVVYVRSGTTGRTYIDGVPSSSTFTASTADTGPISIGWEQQDPTWKWKGYIDDIRIYNRALSTDEVKQLYNSSK